MRQYLRPVVAGLLLFAAACHPGFQLTRYTTNEALYAASLAQFTHHRWDDAIAGFEKLSVNLSARDTLLPRSFWYLARSYQEQREHILAAQTFSRLFTSFPDDSLAAAAALRTAREYRALWPKPDLDPQYGETALAGYSDVLQLYPPPIPQADTAKAEYEQLLDQFARRDYGIGMYYFHDKAFDSARIYFADVLAKFPNTPTARLAALRMIEAFRAVRYNQDAADLCGVVVAKYAEDAEVKRACPGVVPAPTTVRPDTTNHGPTRR
jgi:outer membrane protein assembly factor BamD